MLWVVYGEVQQPVGVCSLRIFVKSAPSPHPLSIFYQSPHLGICIEPVHRVTYYIEEGKDGTAVSVQALVGLATTVAPCQFRSLLWTTNKNLILHWFLIYGNTIEGRWPGLGGQLIYAVHSLVFYDLYGPMESTSSHHLTKSDKFPSE
jgi:hypothetical protein